MHKFLCTLPWIRRYLGNGSASQFNREYGRLFGQPPMRDIKARRLAATATARD